MQLNYCYKKNHITKDTVTQFELIQLLFCRPPLSDSDCSDWEADMNDPEAGGRRATRRRDDSDTDSDSSSSTGGGGGGRHHGVTETLELLSKNRTLDMKTGYRFFF